MARKRNKSRTKKVTPAISTVNKATREARQSKTQISTVAIEQIRRVVECLKPIELSQYNKFHTYQAMLLDDAVFSAVDSRRVLIDRAQAKGYLRWNKDSEESKRVKDFLQWNMDNLDGQTVRGIGATCADMIINGFAPLEKVYWKGKGEYEDKFVLRKLSYIHPLSLSKTYPFTIASDGNTILSINQTQSAFTGTNNYHAFKKFGTYGTDKPVRWDKIAYTAYASTYSQLLGVSPLDGAYNAWREKILLQEITNVGVTKDLAGMPVIEIPIEILNKASSDPTSQEAQLVDDLQNSMANISNGEQSFVILPSDTQAENGSGNRQYNLRFLGVDGGGKNFDCNELVEQRRRAIFTVLGSNNLIIGEKGGGSYNLLEGQSNIQAFYAERDNTIIEEMWNKQVFPQLLRLNEWEVSPEDMPVWESGDIQPVSIDETSKAAQRVGAVGMLPKNDPKFLNEMLKKLGYDYRFDEKLTPEEISNLLGDNTSRAGDGMSEGLNNGVGTSMSDDASVSNTENA